MLGRSFVIRAMHGTVEVRPSPSAGYLRVRGTRSFPLGAEVDVTHGRARIVVAQDRRGTVNQATVTLGAFELTQEFERTHRVLKNTHLRMIGGDFSGCDGAVSSKRRRPTPRRELGVAKHGPIVTDDDRSTGQTSVKGTSWVVRDYCDHTEIEAISGRVQNSHSKSEIAPMFRMLLPGDRALEACENGTGAVRIACLVLFNVRNRDPGAPTNLAGKAVLAFVVDVVTSEVKATVCVQAPGFPERCDETESKPLSGGSALLRRNGLACGPVVAGDYSFRVLIGGQQVGPRLTTTVSGPLPDVSLEQGACSPRPPA